MRTKPGVRCFLLSLSAVLVAGLPASSRTRAEDLSFQDLLDAMTDLKALAVRPHPEEFCKQFSSYDRKTRWDEETQTIVGNNANGDRGQFLRVEPSGHVLADMEGPGVIYRIWSANAAGILKIFIDGDSEPRLSVPMQDLLGGKISPLTEPLAGVRARGWNVYLPVAYQRHCKVVVQDPGAMYYQVTYRTLPKDTKVEPFRWPLPEAWVEGIEKVKTALAHPGKQVSDSQGTLESFWISPGSSQTLDLYGPSALVGIEVKLDHLPEDKQARRELLRRVLVTASWDDEKYAIWAPLGDFFGTAPDANPYPGYPTGIREDGTMYAYWHMPFRNRAELSLQNDGKSAISGTAKLTLQPLSIPEGEMLYFRADWRYEAQVSEFDWPLLVSTGTGRFCGTALYVFNTRTGWWGEGDEKMWIDGERFPSTIGTGSEDYFGYAWCSNETFFNPYHNQPLCEGPGNGNYSSVNRFQVPDNVPFHESARITIEAYNLKTVTYAAMTYWYAAPGTTTDARPVDLKAIEWPEGFKPFVIPGAIEGESLEVVARTPNYAIGVQDISGHGQFSKSNQMWLRPTEAGSTAELVVPGKFTPGRYQLTLWLVRSWDYGTVNWSFNGKPVATGVDGYSPRVVAKEIDCGVVEVLPEKNRLRFEVTGRSDKSTGFYAGIDALRLAPVD